MSEETKQIDPAALASITDGRLLCDFSTMHEAVEHIAGHPVWTHELADRDFANHLRDLVLKQFPEMPLRTETHWEKVRDDVRARYGSTVAVQRGAETRTESPVHSAARLMGETGDD